MTESMEYFESCAELLPGAASAYEEFHKAVPTRVDDSLRRAGVTDWKIFLRDDVLTHCVTVVNRTRMEEILATDPASSWWLAQANQFLVAGSSPHAKRRRGRLIWDLDWPTREELRASRDHELAASKAETQETVLAISAAATPTAPVPVLTSRPPWRETFVSLRVRNYRIFAASNLLANTAMWMQRVAMDWLVLQLSGSVAAVGVTVFMQFAPMLVLGLWGGVITDRYSKQYLLIATQSAAACLAGILALLTLTGSTQVWHVYLISFLLGLVTVVDNPAGQVLVTELVGPKYLRNAISLNASTFQLGGLIGPAVGGILITAVGGGWSFVINAIACLAVVAALCSLKKSELHASPVTLGKKGQLIAGIRYVRSKPVIFWTVMMSAVVAGFAFNMPVFLAAYANTVFHVGAQGYGLFNALVAAGALGGALASTRRTSVRLGMVVGGAAGLGLVQAIAGLAPSEVAFGALLVGIGVCTPLFNTAANSLVHMSSNVQIRGRVISLYILVLYGGQAIGGPLMGWVVEHVGPHVAMIISGSVPAAAAVVIAILIARRGSLRLRFGLRGRRPVIAIVNRAGKSSAAL